jgi:hypothetical protein
MSVDKPRDSVGLYPNDLVFDEPAQAELGALVQTLKRNIATGSSNVIPALISRVQALEAGLVEALDGWANHADHHDVDARIRLRALLAAKLEMQLGAES